MQPQKSARQRLVSFELELDPPAQVFSYADSFGNAVYHFDVPQPHDRLTIDGPLGGGDPGRRPAARRTWTMGEWDRLRSRLRARRELRLPAPARLRPRDRGAAAPIVAEHGLDALRGRDPLTRGARPERADLRLLRLRGGRDPGRQPDRRRAAGARKGVCQDFAHVMIAICRSWGIPARYVSGYLFTDRKHGRPLGPRRHPRLGGGVPAHALRWIGFDPTNNVDGRRAPHRRAPWAATTATCRRRAGSTRARPKASWRWASRCARRGRR